MSTSSPDAPRPVTGKIRQGDVICVEANAASRWKISEGSKWYAYVQITRTLRSGDRKLDVLWLYEPQDTTLGQGYYPWKNELFFSDNCSCGKDAIHTSVVHSKVEVDWFVDDPAAQTCFFVRKKFRTVHTEGSYDFVQLKESDFRCSCLRDDLPEVDQIQGDFKIGDAVLVLKTFGGEEILEPARILKFLDNDEAVLLQQFHRCHRNLGHSQARPNQITPATEPHTVKLDAVVRKCKIAILPSIEHLRSPYDRDGAGDFWFVLNQADPKSAGSLNLSQEAPDSAVEDLDEKTKLQGLGIFCGGGSFDRGLEEGGGVTFKWGVDWAKHALHTYRANAEDPDQMHLWLGSVNDYLTKALDESTGKGVEVAKVGEVDMIAAGSPCPGFSALQQNKTSKESLRNCSLVASVCAYVDVYMPLYLVLENVLGMALNSKKSKDQNVFSQILCCLVAMGYQVQQFLMDPGHFGSCQSRPRIFIVATAPSLTPLRQPPQTHSNPRLTQLGKSIGYSSNGLPFGKRKNDVCAFPSPSTKDAIDDLPDISESHVQTCIRFPDHRLCRHENLEKRVLLSSIPRWPYGQGFMQAYLSNLMPRKQIEGYPWQSKVRSHPNSKSWARVYPDRPVGCITTTVKPHDAWSGQVIHYDQPRILSVMEARRVQSYPDNEVIIGIPSHQWKVIGNSVDRKVAFALGLRLAEAWDRSMQTGSTLMVSKPSAGAVKGTEIVEGPLVTERELPRADPTARSLRIISMASSISSNGKDTPQPSAGLAQQLNSILTPAEGVNSVSNIVMVDAKDQTDLTQDDSPHGFAASKDSAEIMQIDDPPEHTKVDVEVHESTKPLHVHQSVEQTPDNNGSNDRYTRRSFENSSVRLIVPIPLVCEEESNSRCEIVVKQMGKE